MIGYRDYLRLLPKAELHCHFVATIRPRTLVELARRYEVPLPSYDVDTLFDYDNIVDFLTVFEAATHVFVNRDVFRQVAYEGVEDAVATGNLRYREYFVNAGLFPIPYAAVLDGIIDGLQAAEQEFGVGYGIIPAIARFQTPEEGIDLVRTILDDGRPAVVGLGQDYLTADGTESPELWTAAYALATEHGLRCTAHVGEIPGSTADAITVAVRDLGCSRIDHGYHVMDDPAVVEMARDLQIPFTCTPRSTEVLSGWAPSPSHPVAQMIRAGLNVTLSTDDPTFFGTDIGREYAEALPAMGYGPEVASRIALAGVEASWTQPARKARMKADFTAQIRALDAMLDASSIGATIAESGGLGAGNPITG
jgi:adenosine deaminase